MRRLPVPPPPRVPGWVGLVLAIRGRSVGRAPLPGDSGGKFDPMSALHRVPGN